MQAKQPSSTRGARILQGISIILVLILGGVYYFKFYKATPKEPSKDAIERAQVRTNDAEMASWPQKAAERETRMKFVLDSTATADSLATLRLANDTTIVAAAGMADLEAGAAAIAASEAATKLNQAPKTYGNDPISSDDTPTITGGPVKKKTTRTKSKASSGSSDEIASAPNYSVPAKKSKKTTPAVTDAELEDAHGMAFSGSSEDVQAAPVYNLGNTQENATRQTATGADDEFTERGVSTNQTATSTPSKTGKEYNPLKFNAKKASLESKKAALENLGYEVEVIGKLDKGDIVAAMNKAGLTNKTLTELYREKHLKGGDHYCAIESALKTGNIVTVETRPTKPVLCGDDMQRVNPVSLALAIQALDRWDNEEYGNPYQVVEHPDKLQAAVDQFPGGRNEIASRYLNSSTCNNKIDLVIAAVPKKAPAQKAKESRK